MSIDITEHIKSLAIEVGFDACGISKAQEMPVDTEHLDDYISKNHNAKMDYMARNRHIRSNPSILFENTNSIITVLINYYQGDAINPNFNIGRYALGRDYHKLIKEKLFIFAKKIQETYNEFNFKAFVDSGPVFDKALAREAGLGWQGKNTLLLNKKMGSFIMIGHLITDLDLITDTKQENLCGNCTKCIDACPTNALLGNGRLDANKCLSYINKRKEEEIYFKQDSHKQLFGCDICQDACPWNSKLSPCKEKSFYPKQEYLNLNKKDMLSLSKSDFKSMFKGSIIYTFGYDYFMRNVKAIYT